MIEALGRADEQGVPAAGGQHRADHLGPGGNRAVGPFVADEEPQARAAQGLVVVDAHQPDHMAAGQGD